MYSRNSETDKNAGKHPLLFINNIGPKSNPGNYDKKNQSYEKSSKDTFPHRKFFVEVINDGVSGSISAVLQSNRTAEIRDFYIIEDAEDSGIRDRLLERAEKYCEKKNVERIQAKIFPDMKEYFISRGFEIEERLKDHFQRGEDILVVSKLLRRK